jgi:DNA-binding CsgD family transcriptional regulator
MNPTADGAPRLSGGEDGKLERMSTAPQIRWSSPLATLRRQRIRKPSVRKSRMLPVLTPRQMQIAERISLGMRNQEIADILGITNGTLRVYVSQAFIRAGVKTRLALALWFREHFGRSRDARGEVLLVPSGPGSTTSCFE